MKMLTGGFRDGRTALAAAAAGLVLAPVISADAAVTKERASAAIVATITFDGGNAFVFHDGDGRVDAGAIAPDGSSSYNAHRMYLVLEQGNADGYGPYAARPATMMIEGKPAWPLQGFDVWPCADGNCPKDSTLVVPGDEIAGAPCDPNNAKHPNMYYLPNMLDQDLYSGAKLETDWCERLESRMVLKAGTFQVTSASDCFEFSDPHGAKWRQKLAHDKAEIRYDVPVTSALVVYFKSSSKPCLTDSGAVAGAVRFTPDSNGLRLRVRSDATSYGSVAVDDEIKHFQQFYDLVELNGADRRKLYYKSSRTPGSECPAARFGGPAALEAQPAPAPSPKH